jgi:hypothetical protein
MYRIYMPVTYPENGRRVVEVDLDHLPGTDTVDFLWAFSHSMTDPRLLVFGLGCLNYLQTELPGGAASRLVLGILNRDQILVQGKDRLDLLPNTGRFSEKTIPSDGEQRSPRNNSIVLLCP